MMKKKFPWGMLLPVLVLLTGVALLLLVLASDARSEREKAHTMAEMNATSYSDRLQENLHQALDVTKTMKQILISRDGNTDWFPVIAENLMSDALQSIQLAPGGVVTDIYPETGNEAGKIDLFADEARERICRYGRDNHVATLQGPFDLKQGGRGIALRDPVYLKNDRGEETFWGFTITIIRLPEIFEDSVEALKAFGYDYRLSKSAYPIDQDFVEVDASAAALDKPVAHTFTVGNCTWKLEVMPAGGWNGGTHTVWIWFFGMLIVLLTTALASMLVVFDRRRRHFQTMANTDALTLLLNRYGFDEAAAGYVTLHEKEPCVGILMDIDNFKFINDLYGHAAGDQALRTLAESLRQCFPGKAILGRNGGDEFCALLMNTTIAASDERIHSFAARQRTFYAEGQARNFSISLGYAEYPRQASSVSSLLSRADMALYEVKMGGKQGCLAYDDQICGKKERTQLGFVLDDISENLPGAFLIYKADKTDDHILFANQELIRFAGCQDLTDFLNFCNHSFRNLVRPDEYDQVEESIWRQIDSQADGSNDYVTFHFARKDGTYREVLDHGRIMESRHYGRLFYVLFVEREMLREHYENGASAVNAE